MRIPICLRGKRAASMHRVKVWGAMDSPNGRILYDMPPLRMRISKIVCNGGLPGCESTRLSDPAIAGRRLFWRRGCSGCKNQTRSELEEQFLWHLFPADSSPLCGGLGRPRCALGWRAHRGSERIGIYNLVLP